MYIVIIKVQPCAIFGIVHMSNYKYTCIIAKYVYYAKNSTWLHNYKYTCI